MLSNFIDKQCTPLSRKYIYFNMVLIYLCIIFIFGSAKFFNVRFNHFTKFYQMQNQGQRLNVPLFTVLFPTAPSDSTLRRYQCCVTGVLIPDVSRVPVASLLHVPDVSRVSLLNVLDVPDVSRMPISDVGGLLCEDSSSATAEDDASSSGSLAHHQRMELLKSRLLNIVRGSLSTSSVDTPLTPATPAAAVTKASTASPSPPLPPTPTIVSQLTPMP